MLATYIGSNVAASTALGVCALAAVDLARAFASGSTLDPSICGSVYICIWEVVLWVCVHLTIGFFAGHRRVYSHHDLMLLMVTAHRYIGDI